MVVRDGGSMPPEVLKRWTGVSVFTVRKAPPPEPPSKNESKTESGNPQESQGKSNT